MALADLGLIAKTAHVLRYAHDPSYRRRIRVGLNLIERLHALARVLFFGRQGRFQDGSLDAQLSRSTALSLVLNAIIVWNTHYLTDAADILETRGTPVPADYWRQASPIQWDHIQIVGQYDFTEHAT